MKKCSLCGERALEGIEICPECLKKAAVLSQKAKQARETQRRITPPGMTYGEYMEYLKDKRQQLEEKKKSIQE